MTPLATAAELVTKLANSEQVRTRMVRQWFRFAYGRIESNADACTLSQLTSTFAASEHDVRALLVALTQTDSFLFRRTGSQSADQAPKATAAKKLGKETVN